MALACGLLAAMVFLAGGLEGIESSLADARFRMLRHAASGDVVVVAIDLRSLDLIEAWPWPRSYHATVLENLLSAGADRVGFALDFSSLSSPGEDAAFASALSEAPRRAVLPVFRQQQPDGGVVFIEPIPPLRRAAALAAVNIRPEASGAVRRYWPTETGQDGGFPSLALALQTFPQPEVDPFHLDFSIEPSTVPHLSYVDVLNGHFDGSTVRGRAVIVGASAAELGDRVKVPVHASLSGPLVQALAHESLAGGRTLRRMPAVAVAAAAVLVAWLLGGPLQETPWRRGLAFLAAAAVGLFGVSLVAQWGAPVLLDTSPLVLALMASFAAGLVHRIDPETAQLVLRGAPNGDPEPMMHHVVTNSFEAIITVDEASRILAFNPAAERMFGYPAVEVIGSPVETMIVGGLPENLRGGCAPRDGAGHRRDGSAFVLEMTVTGFTLEGRGCRVAFLRDITLRRAQEHALKHQATHDALTDLPNRVMLQQRMEEALDLARRSGGTAAVLILDLDRFKEVNDTLGHQVGDHLLRRIADRLRRPLRPTDTIARVGGDEFAILLPDSGRTDARTVADRLTLTLKKPFEVQGLSLQVDTSIGVAMFPEHGDEASTLIQRADVAMYAAKKSRTTLTFYRPEKDFASVRHLTLRGELRRAVEEDHLVLFYQPKVDTQTGRVAGAEALLRWRHPEHGLLPPDEFIPLAEHTGLIKPIIGWVLASAIKQCAAWEAQGHRVPVSVNCSARNLLQEDLPKRIQRTLQNWRLPADRLTLEITEAVLVEDPNRALEVATELAGLGVRLSIDDFGTGHSSLKYLRKLPIRELKIDKSFVARMDRDEGDAVIVRSTVDLAHNLGLTAVAEGVETQIVWKLLRALGCDLAQGYYFGKPVPAAEFEELLEAPSWPVLTEA